MSQSRNRFAKNALMQYGLQVAKYLFPFITIPYLTRVLGPDVYAVRAYVLAAMTFAQIVLDYGFNAYGTRQVSLWRSDEERVCEEMTSIALLRIALCLAFIPVLVIATINIPIMDSNAIYVAIAYVCVCFKAMLPDYVFQGYEEMGIITYRFIISQAIATILIFMLIRAASDLLWVPTLEALAAFIAFAWSWENVLVKRHLRFTAVSRGYMVDAFKTSTVFFLSQAATAVFTNMTTIMIGVLISDETQISYWALATTAIGAIQSLYTPITNSLYPHVCATKDIALVRRLLLIGTPVVLIGTVSFALLSDYVMLLLGGVEYLDGAYIVALLSPLLFLSFPAMLIGFPVLAAVGLEKQLTASSITASLFHVTGLFILFALDVFSIESVCILRCMTESILLLVRAQFVIAWRHTAD